MRATDLHLQIRDTPGVILVMDGPAAFREGLLGSLPTLWHLVSGGPSGPLFLGHNLALKPAS